MTARVSRARPDAGCVGDAIRALRRQQHLSQAELGRRIGMKPGPMNNIEQGKNLPSTPVLCRLAAELNVGVDDLLGPCLPPGGYVREKSAPCTAGPRANGAARRQPGAAPEDGFSRLPAAGLTRPLPPAVTEARPVVELLDEMAGVYLALEDICGAPKRAAIPLFLGCERTRPGLERLAGHVRRLSGVGQAVVFDYLELFENLGLRVLFLGLPAAVESLSCYDEPNGNAFIFIRRELNPEKQLFRLLYELGWIYLFTQECYGGMPEVGGSEEALDSEHSARAFAALFLMPADAVRTSVAQTGVRPAGWSYDLVLRLKHRFGVSAESFVIRLEELELIVPTDAQRFKDQIRAYYRRTRFGEPDSTRRILSPNGRLGDLLLTARRTNRNGREVSRIAARLRARGVGTR